MMFTSTKSSPLQESLRESEGSLTERGGWGIGILSCAKTLRGDGEGYGTNYGSFFGGCARDSISSLSQYGDRSGNGSPQHVDRSMGDGGERVFD
jgi:hypothetical protein